MQHMMAQQYECSMIRPATQMPSAWNAPDASICCPGLMHHALLTLMTAAVYLLIDAALKGEHKACTRLHGLLSLSLLASRLVVS